MQSRPQDIQNSRPPLPDGIDPSKTWRNQLINLETARLWVAEDDAVNRQVALERLKPIVSETFAAAGGRRLTAEKKMSPPNDKRSAAKTGGEQHENKSALCEKTLQALREIGSDVGPSFFSQLLETFRQDAIEHLSLIRSAIAGGQAGPLGREAHALKGASLTIGAKGMAEICKQLENLGTAHHLEGAPAALACLDREFDRVKNEIKHESLTP